MLRYVGVEGLTLEELTKQTEASLESRRGPLKQHFCVRNLPLVFAMIAIKPSRCDVLRRNVEPSGNTLLMINERYRDTVRRFRQSRR